MSTISSRNVLVIVFGVIGAILVGFLIGWFSKPSETLVIEKPTVDESFAKIIRDEIQPANIEENLKFLSEEPHIAGRSVDEEKLVTFIREKWEDYGLHVEVHPYDVLLSYPNQEDSNQISVKLSNGTEVRKSDPVEKILDDSQISEKVVNPFNAYSATGDVEGKLVYVNYARIEDFIQLTRDLGVNPNGSVCISRYGRIFRGSKAIHAQDYGCTGLILYSDPLDYAVSWAGVYPDDWFLPGTGAQRGNLHIVKGDPLTPQYPAIDTAWRLYENETQLPKIPVTPIGYDDAIKYLEIMGGDEVPNDWKGGLEITYRLGPDFIAEHSSSKVKMHVTAKNERAVTHNIFGYIEGTVEPDRYVLIGNHRDAWVFGAIDPSSGTASMLEVSRSYGLALKNGWKPRRTIIFCSWGAEEYGILGSTEWVEEFQKVLSSRAVAYLNLDTTVQGNFSMSAAANPNLKEMMMESSKFAENPSQSEQDEGRETVYDTWAFRYPNDASEENSIPYVGTLGSGSDFTPFVQVTGISSTHMKYTYDESIGIRSYPVYHSVYETFDLMKTFVDPDFKIHASLAQVLAEMGRRMADSIILPMNCRDYAAKLVEDKDVFVDSFGTKMTAHGMDMTLFDKALDSFTAAANEIHQRADSLDTSDTLALRTLNDQLMQLDRAFIDMNGIGERINFRHVIYAPSLHNTYASSAFPGLSDSLFDIDADPDQEGRWREVDRQYSILLYHIGSAASTLKTIVPIKGYSNS